MMVKRKLCSGVLAGVMAAGLALAPAGAMATPKKPPKKVKCAPGALTTDASGKVTHVCDKNGNWVKVLRMTAAAQAQRDTTATTLGAGS
jgi:hypothetical protein